MGEGGGRSASETGTALNLCAGEGFSFSRVMVVTSYGCAAEWKGVAPSNVSWCLLEDEEISSVEIIESRVEANLSDLIRNYVLVMDCTSATKPATIAYYKLAVNYHVPLVYVYEKKRELTWIISKEDLRKKLIGDTEK